MAFETSVDDKWGPPYHETTVIMDTRGTRLNENLDITDLDRRIENMSLKSTSRQESHQRLPQNQSLAGRQHETPGKGGREPLLRSRETEEIRQRSQHSASPPCSSSLSSSYIPTKVEYHAAPSQTSDSTTNEISISIPASAKDHFTELELKKLEFNQKKFFYYYQRDEWNTAEVFVLAVIRILSQKEDLNIITNQGLNLLDCYFLLLVVQEFGKKWAAMIESINFISKIPFKPNLAIQDLDERLYLGRAWSYYKLGLLDKAKDMAEKGVMLLSGKSIEEKHTILRVGSLDFLDLNTHNLNLWAIDLLIYISRDLGDKADMEFYKELLRQTK